MTGLVCLGLTAVVLILAVRYLGPWLTGYLLLPVVAVFGRRIARRFAHMMTAGRVCIP